MVIACQLYIAGQFADERAQINDKHLNIVKWPFIYKCRQLV